MKLILPLFFTIFSCALFAQDLVLVSTGASYGQQAYYKLSNDATVNIDNDAWDIAFTTIGQQDAGIHVNESARTSFGSPQPQVEVYAAPTNNWDDTIEPDSLTERLYNDEDSWTYGGAFNQGRDGSDVFDFGWGQYNFMNNQVQGSKVYVIKLRSGAFKKFQIQSLVLTTYTFRYADLDGSNEVIKTLNKLDYEFSNFAYFSFDSETFISDIPNEWDLEFCRYITPISDGQGNFIPFGVTGVLSGFGVEVAEASGVDPDLVAYAQYEDSLSADIDIIGYDWKNFENNMAWVLADDLVYFVKTLDDEVYKITFLQFGGSASGEVIFEKELITTSSTADLSLAKGQFMVTPNPAQGQTTLLLELETASPNLDIHLLNMSGKVMAQYNTSGQAGLNAITLQNLPDNKGLYLLQVTDGQKLSTLKISIQ